MKIERSNKSGKAVLRFDARTEQRIEAVPFKTLRKLPSVKIKKILTATDFSDLSMMGVDYAMALATELRLSLSLVNVVEPSTKLGGVESVVIARSDAEVVKIEKKHLARLAKRLAKGASPIAHFTRYGKPFREIAALANEQNFDLIVLATHGHTGLKRIMVGSTAEWVVRHAPCAVLTVPAQIAKRKSGEGWAGSLRRILVPVDFSETSTKALPYAATLAAGFKAEVILIHVTEPPPATEFGYALSTEMETQSRKSAEELLLRVQQEGFDETIHTETIVRSGLPYQEITQPRLDSDLIILTTHGHTGFKHALLGSTAERIVRYANCPVLVVRDKD